MRYSAPGILTQIIPGWSVIYELGKKKVDGFGLKIAI
jgi:hypothetical protein